ncbi:MAG: hypothetical protein WA795_13485 [Candidatus Sulfotelmatobacter sp.]
MSRSFLYRRLGFAVMVALAFFVVIAPPASAQGRPELKRPEPDIPQEKPPEPKKKVKGPRAVALLRLTNGGKATLIPIAILVDGKFYDAGEYKADPVPMALDSGTVYEAEDSGDSLGLFTVSGALHSKTAGATQPWVGSGSYALNGAAVANAPHKAENVPVGLNSGDDDAPPRLTREKSTKAPTSPSSGPAAGAPASAASASTTPASTTPASTTPAGTGPPEKPAAASAPPSTTPPVNGSTGSSPPSSQKPGVPPASDKPPDQSAKQPAPASGQSTSGQTSPGSQAQASQAPPAQGQATQSQTDYYRPTLRRGKPTQGPPPDVNDEVAPKTGNAGSPASVAAAGPGPVQLIPAISDAGGPEPKSYKFFWKTGEEEERRNQMLALAGNEVQAYVKALARNQIPAQPPAAKPATARHKAPAKAIQPVLENVQFHAFDVWSNNQVVMILSAEAHFPPAPGASAAPEQYSITLVTRTDIYGDLRKLYSGVTDKFHLDVTPRLELIDAVDADGDGRGELLFRETTDAGNGYVIYLAGADKLFKMFDSLGEQE